MVGRNLESYSQLREAAKHIIAKVAGRLSGVRLSGLMDPAVTGLERAAVVANTPITFRPRELLGVSELLSFGGFTCAKLLLFFFFFQAWAPFLLFPLSDYLVGGAKKKDKKEEKTTQFFMLPPHVFPRRIRLVVHRTCTE